MAAGLSSLGALARAADYDRYFSAIFAPLERRETLFALIVFHHEVSHIPQKVSEPMLGHIRFQWWRETLDAMAAASGGAERRHEIVPPLAAALGAGVLDSAALGSILDACEGELENEGFADLAALARHGAATGGLLTTLMLESSGADSAAAREAGRQAGTAWTLVSGLRCLARGAGRGRLPLPQNLLAHTGMSEAEIRAGQGFDRLAPAVRPVVDAAEEALAAARRAGRAIPRKARAPLLIARAADLHLAGFRRGAYDLRYGRPEPAPLRRQAAMLAGAVSGRY